MRKIFLTANTSWYLFNYRLDLAQQLQEQKYVPIFVSPVDEYTKKIIDAGFRHIPIDMERKFHSISCEIRSIIQYYKILKHEQPSLVHNHTSKSVLYGGIATRILKIPTVSSITGLGYIFTKSSFKFKLLRQLILVLYKLVMRNNRRSLVIFQNQFNMKFFIENRIVRVNAAFLVPGSGADGTIFYPSEEIKQGAPIVLLPSRMLWSKGVETFYKAGMILREMGVNCRMVLAGSPDPGNPDSIPLDVIHQWVDSGVVEYWGWQTNIASVYNKSHIIVYPSLYPEGLPRTLIEAALCAKPIIASEVPGCTDIIIDELNGLIFKPNNANELAEKIDRYLQDPNLRRKMGQMARELALQNNEQKIIANKTIAVYKELLPSFW